MLSEGELKNVAEEIDKNNQQRQEFRKLRIESRDEVRHGDHDFNDYVERTGEFFIEKSLTRNHADSQKSLDTW